MCLAVPMRVISRDGYTARCTARGVERAVSLFLLQHEAIGPGDHIMVHLGEAIEKVDAAEAEAAWALYDEIFAAEDAARSSVPPGPSSPAKSARRKR